MPLSLVRDWHRVSSASLKLPSNEVPSKSGPETAVMKLGNSISGKLLSQCREPFQWDHIKLTISPPQSSKKGLAVNFWETFVFPVGSPLHHDLLAMGASTVTWQIEEDVVPAGKAGSTSQLWGQMVALDEEVKAPMSSVWSKQPLGLQFNLI